MDLLKTLLLYMSLVFSTSVQMAPEVTPIPVVTAAPTAYVQPATATPVPTVKPTPVPTIDIAPNTSYKTLQVGDKGDRVREMQEKLQAYGYYSGELDGRFGNGTRLAVEKFQYQHGLTADGIAGKRTLTVLYDSDDVRYSPDALPTPSPTQTLAPALTPQPETSALPFLPMEGWQITVEQNETQLVPYQSGEEYYLPMLEVLRASSWNAIVSDTLEKSEFAFAVGENIIRLSYSENKLGQLSALEVSVNQQSQTLPENSAYMAQKHLYLSTALIERLSGITVETDKAAQVITVHMPKAEQ